MKASHWMRVLLALALCSLLLGQKDENSCWGGECPAPQNCCASGSSVAGMTCSQVRTWLVCLGVLFEPENFSCEYTGADVVRMVPSELADQLGFTEEEALRVAACRTFKTRGVVYSAYAFGQEGADILLELRHSVLSVLSVPENRILGITVMVDVLPSECGTDVSELTGHGVRFQQVDAEGQLHSAFKLRAMLHTPYEHTLFLDTDTEICSDLYPVFQVLPRFDFAAVQAPVLFYERNPDPLSVAAGVPETFVQYCAAVMAFSKNERVVRMLARAVVEADRLHPMGFLDQAALRTALWLSGDVRDYGLPPQWMCRGARHCSNAVSNQVVLDVSSQRTLEHLSVPCDILHTHSLHAAR